MKATTCATAVALALSVAAIGSAANASLTGSGLDPLDPLVLPAVKTARAAQSVLVAITKAGERLIAAGEGGIVVTSDDDGRSWSQADVPVSVTLTSVQFVTPSLGWAVGHSGVVLATTDSGRSWSKKFDGLSRVRAQGGAAQGAQAGMAAGGASDPLLDIHFLDAKRGFVVGAFGLFLRTKDGGATWESWDKHLPNPDGNHLYGVRSTGDQVYVVGERGSIYASRDRGETFTALKSPYEGSFFGLTVAADDTVVVYGLRGRAFASDDRGETWRAIAVVSGSAWTGTAAMPDGRMALVGQAGDVAVGDAHGRTLVSVGGRRASLSAAVANRRGDLVAVGPRGVMVIDMSSLKRQQGDKS